MATDPVCGMQVETANAPASTMHAGHRVYFCSDNCSHRFADNPDRFGTRVKAAISSGSEGIVEMCDQTHHLDTDRGKRTTVDPVCGMSVDPGNVAGRREHNGQEYFFCSTGCTDAFDADPDSYGSGTTPSAHEAIGVHHDD